MWPRAARCARRSACRERPGGRPEPRRRLPRRLRLGRGAAAGGQGAHLSRSGRRCRGREPQGRHGAAQKDTTNLGLIHTPSINHAATAAVLRNAHVAHSGEISVDISSRRVRSALAILEGMRGGQSLGALLGYRFERHVHDHGPLTVRALVYPLRRAYPLVADQIPTTATTAATRRSRSPP